MNGESDLFWTTVNFVLETIIKAAVPVLIVMTLDAVRKWREQMKLKIGETRWYQAEAIVRANVLAAEQLGLIDEALKFGAQKKQWVIERSQAALDERKIKLAVGELVTLVESLVFTDLNHGKPKARVGATNGDPFPNPMPLTASAVGA